MLHHFIQLTLIVIAKCISLFLDLLLQRLHIHIELASNFLKLQVSLDFMVLHVTGVLSLIIFNDELKLIDSISIQLLLRLNAFKFLEKLIVPRKSLVKFLSELSSIFVIALQLL